MIVSAITLLVSLVSLFIGSSMGSPISQPPITTKDNPCQSNPCKNLRCVEASFACFGPNCPENKGFICLPHIDTQSSDHPTTTPYYPSNNNNDDDDGQPTTKPYYPPNNNDDQPTTKPYYPPNNNDDDQPTTKPYHPPNESHPCDNNPCGELECVKASYACFNPPCCQRKQYLCLPKKKNLVM